jgi:hypothetical protein
MEIKEAKSAIKAVYLQAASMAGFEVGPQSPEGLAAMVDDGFGKVIPTRRPEAVANLLRVIAATLDYAQESGSTMLHETDIEGGRQRVCPVYPFGAPASANRRQVVSGRTRKKLRRRG